jgi:hypothetical protein
MINMKMFDNISRLPLLFNPFVVEQYKANPFKAKERSFPVDFGAPLDESVVITFEYPEGLKLADIPPPISITLPGNNGSYSLAIQHESGNNKVSLNSALVISKAVFTSAEYPLLRNLFAQMITAQNTDLVLEKK